MVVIEKYNQELNKLSSSVKSKYNKIIKSKSINNYIQRSITPTMATIIEDEIAKFLKNVFNNKNYYFLIDHDLGNYRPDILVLEETANNSFNLKYIFEIKSNPGYCRNIKAEDFEKKREKITNPKNQSFSLSKFKRNKKLYNPEKCNNKFLKKLITSKPPASINVPKDVKIICLMYVINEKIDQKDKCEKDFNCNRGNILYYVLFNNWYNDAEKSYCTCGADALFKKIQKLENNKRP